MAKKEYLNMGELYDRIASLCSNKGIRPGKMCNDLGISRGSIGDLKKGRREGISIKTATKIADYFGVTTDYLLTGDETKKAPTQEGEREITMDDFTYAFYKESKDLPDEKKKMLLDMARFMKSDIEKGKG